MFSRGRFMTSENARRGKCAVATGLAACLVLAAPAAAKNLPLPAPGQGHFTVLKHPSPKRAFRFNGPSPATIPFWTGNVVSPLDGQAYSYAMAGNSPYAATKTLSQIQYIPIIVKYHFGSTVLDPTHPACGDTKPVTARFLNSPLFKPVALTSNGINVATGSGASKLQLMDIFQRAGFWSSVAGSKFGVKLVRGAKNIVVNLNAPAGSQLAQGTFNCGGVNKQVYLLEVDINAFDAQIQSLVAAYASPSQLPMILTHNVVETQGGSCCILGYHSAVDAGGVQQTYAVGGYFDIGIFAGGEDITTWSHELAEWMDDPFVNNETPAWGHVGQVSDCQADLEVADPLSGTEFSILGTGGFVYHYQDLAFSDWFFRTPSQGTGGKYSFRGLFT